LLKNLREALEHLFDRRFDSIKEVLRANAAKTAEIAPEAERPNQPTSPLSSITSPDSGPDSGHTTKYKQRVDRFEEVRRLHQAGMPIRALVRQLSLSRATVRRYLRNDTCPEWQSGQQRPMHLDGFQEFVDIRIREGCTNATIIYRELVEHGCRTSVSTVRRFFNRRLTAVGRERQGRPSSSTMQPPSPRRLSFSFLRRREKRKPEEQSQLDSLTSVDPELREGIVIAASFTAMVRKESARPLTDWLEEADRSSCDEIRRYAEGLRKDDSAVTAALTEHWSNGAVEGHVNRLKTIKRQMYGRASFQLLRARALHVA